MSDQPPSADAIFQQAVARHQAGRLEEAEALYRQILRTRSDHVQAQNNLGLALASQGRPNDAVAHYQRALDLKSDYAEAHFNLGNAFNELGKADDAVACYERAIVLRPNYSDALCNLGLVLTNTGKLEGAITVYRRALVHTPDSFPLHFNLGLALQTLGDFGEAVVAFQCALALKPDQVGIYLNLGSALKSLGRLDEAVNACRRALELKPDYAEGYNNLGNIFAAQGRFDEAVSAFERALTLNPNDTATHNNLGVALHAMSRLDEAAITYQRALALNPDYAEVHSNLGNTLNARGELNESLAHYRRALELDPGLVACHLNLLGGILCHPGYDDAARFAEHLRFARMHAPVRIRSTPYANPPDPHRRLRLGYVSADLRNHPVAHNLIPIVEAHDRSQFELFFYADLRRPDDMTARFRGVAEGWRITNGLSDTKVAEAIRADGIDILVCLAGHFDGNRPLVAAHKPAPVGVSFLDPATSGLAAMDYLIADRVLIPRRNKESFVERVVRLPVYYLAQPIDAAPPVNSLPVLSSGGVTFGCLNNPSKITDDVLKLWGALMREVPESKLFLKYKRNYASAVLRERVRTVLGQCGIAPERIDMQTEDQGRTNHLALYGGIDVALDPFPYCGGMTTFEALWMGVPVVTLAGDFMVGRWSASMLSALGLPELVAATPAEYIAIGRHLAADPKGLVKMRAGLRARVAVSPLCDGPGRTRQIERLYRAMWRRWCGRSAARS